MTWRRCTEAAAFCCLLATATAPSSAAPVRTGLIRGHVTVVGQAPGNTIIRMGMDPKCAEIHRGERVLQESVAVGRDGSLANAFVKIEGTFPSSSVPNDPVVVDQRGCLYHPRVVGMRVGQTLQVRNSDDVLHNVHSTSTAGNTFNVGQPTAGLVFSFTPRAEDIMRIGCDVHSWMTTFVAVVSHPYFSVTDAQGTFAIAAVPVGTYQLRIWHERLGEAARTVTVKAGETATIDYGYTPGVR